MTRLKVELEQKKVRNVDKVTYEQIDELVETQDWEALGVLLKLFILHIHTSKGVRGM